MDGFELVESSRNVPAEQNESQKNNSVSNSSKMVDALTNNFGTILELVGRVLEIQKMETASDAVLAKMAEDRKILLDEAQAYAIKKRADTSSVVERMNVIKSMMQDFYAQSDGNMSGEDFCKIITEVVNQMGRVEHGI
jgi:hypothetical protein